MGQDLTSGCEMPPHRRDAGRPELPADPGGGFPGLASRDSVVLRLFRAWHEAELAHDERRESPRYRPREDRAWAGWWGRGHFVVCRASLINLSAGGALVLLARQPPLAQPVWICLGLSDPSGTVQGRVHESRAVTAPPPGLDASPCPFEAVEPGPIDLDAADDDETPALATGVGLAYVSRVEFHGPCPPAFFASAGRGPANGAT